LAGSFQDFRLRELETVVAVFERRVGRRLKSKTEKTGRAWKPV
jgi:hypothetical protein